MERFRRTMMFVPASNPGMMRDSIIYRADSIMFDLEDSISINEKDTSRFLAYSALKNLDFSGIETVVRINDLNLGGIDDIHAMIRAGVDVIRLPKTSCAQDVLDAESIMIEAEKQCGREVNSTKIIVAIEDHIGVLNSLSIAQSSKRIIGIALGAEDYVTSMKTRRYTERNSEEIFFARSMIVHAARATGISALDTVFSDVNDMETLKKETEFIKQLGFDGKSVINPRQISIVNKVFTPTQKEIDNAIAVMEAIEEAERNGSGVISLKGKMIDKPIVERAKRVIELAKKSGVWKTAI